MTKEIGDIIKAFGTAHREGRRAALATVVHVEGSSYRMPGARMLVEENGCITGAVSGGCLEGDALRKALLAINLGQNKLVTYDTTHEDDAKFGVQLGCNGIVHILFEPIDATYPDNPVAILNKFLHGRSDVVLVTLFALNNTSRPQPGTSFLLHAGITASRLADKALEADIRNDAAAVLAGRSSALKYYDQYGLSAFIELILPPVSLVIVGAGNDAMPLAQMAAILGWRVTIADGRPTHATAGRFPLAHRVIVGKPSTELFCPLTDDRTVFVLMSHNYNYDLAALKVLLQTNAAYIGTLGPKTRLLQLLAAIEGQGTEITAAQYEKIYGPTGLDIGAETPEEIALSILAEIKAVLGGNRGGSLRLRQAAIHTRPEKVATENHNNRQPANR